MLNPDFRDMLAALSAENVEFLVVGAYAVSAHGFPRATGDLDIWIRPQRENAERAWRALKKFKAPMRNLSLEDLITPDIVFQIGVAPRRIDLMTSIDAVEFDEAWAQRKDVDIDGLRVAVLGREHLLRNKKACGRPKDVADAAWLESSKDEKESDEQ
jgi:type IV secretory pathway protease TraF